jgi:hypothetical protein
MIRLATRYYRFDMVSGGGVRVDFLFCRHQYQAKTEFNGEKESKSKL